MDGTMVEGPVDSLPRRPRPLRQASIDKRRGNKKVELARNSSGDADYSNSSEQRPLDDDVEEDERPAAKEASPLRTRRGAKGESRSRRGSHADVSVQVPGDSSFSFHQQDDLATEQPHKSPKSPRMSGFVKSPTKKTMLALSKSPRSNSSRSISNHGGAPRPRTAGAGSKTLRRRPAHFSGELPVGEDPDVSSVTTSTADMFGEKSSSGNATTKSSSLRSMNRTFRRQKTPSWSEELASLDSGLEKINLDQMDGADLGFVKGMDALMPEEAPEDEADSHEIPDSGLPDAEEEDDPLGRPETIGMSPPPAGTCRVLQKMQTQTMRREVNESPVERLLGLQVAGDEGASTGQGQKAVGPAPEQPEAELFGKARTLQSLKSQKGLAGAMLTEGVAKFFAESEKAKLQPASSFSRARTLGLSKRPSTSDGGSSRRLPPLEQEGGSAEHKGEAYKPHVTEEGDAAKPVHRERHAVPGRTLKSMTTEPVHRVPIELETVAEDETATGDGPALLTHDDDCAVGELGDRDGNREQDRDWDRDRDEQMPRKHSPIAEDEGRRSSRHPKDEGGHKKSSAEQRRRTRERSLSRAVEGSKKDKELGQKTLSRHSKAPKKDNFVDQEFDHILDEFMKNPHGRSTLSRRRERRPTTGGGRTRRSLRDGSVLEDQIIEEGEEGEEAEEGDPRNAQGDAHGYGHGALRSGFSIPRFSMPGIAAIPHVGGTPRQMSGVFNIFKDSHKTHQAIPVEADPHMQ